MNKRIVKRSLCVLIILTLTVFSVSNFQHSGRTDAYGGHYNRSTGEYHYHHGRPAHQHTNGICPYDTPVSTPKSTPKPTPIPTPKPTVKPTTTITVPTEKVHFYKAGEVWGAKLGMSSKQVQKAYRDMFSLQANDITEKGDRVLSFSGAKGRVYPLEWVEESTEYPYVRIDCTFRNDKLVTVSFHNTERSNNVVLLDWYLNIADDVSLVEGDGAIFYETNGIYDRDLYNVIDDLNDNNIDTTTRWSADEYEVTAGIINLEEFPVYSFVLSSLD